MQEANCPQCKLVALNVASISRVSTFCVQRIEQRRQKIHFKCSICWLPPMAFFNEKFPSLLRREKGGNLSGWFFLRSCTLNVHTLENECQAFIHSQSNLKPYITQVWLSFVDCQNYHQGSLHTECGFPFCLGILSIRQTVAQTVFSLPRNHRTLFLRPTHCLDEPLFACKWGVQKTSMKDNRLHKCTCQSWLFYSYRRCL